MESSLSSRIGHRSTVFDDDTNWISLSTRKWVCDAGITTITKPEENIELQIWKISNQDYRMPHKNSSSEWPGGCGFIYLDPFESSNRLVKNVSFYYVFAHIFTFCGQHFRYRKRLFQKIHPQLVEAVQGAVRSAEMVNREKMWLFWDFDLIERYKSLQNTVQKFGALANCSPHARG